MIKIGRIAYLNTEPFFHKWPAQEEIELIPGTPRELALSAQGGGLDGAPLPLVECWRLEKIFEPLGLWGIAVREAAGSVLLFSKKKITNLEGAVVGVTEETSTSVILLDLLLRVRYCVRVVLRRGFTDEDEARLLIGDSALVHRQEGLIGFPFVYDLGREWIGWQKRPFVFARWVVRRSLPESAKSLLQETLASSFSAGSRMIPEISRVCAPRLGLSAPVVRDYLNGFSYELGEAEEEAMTLFRGLKEKAAR
jgi:chorismate dehydratase